MSCENIVIGVDFGSDSVRAICVDAITGRTLGEGVSAYTRWAGKQYCDPGSNQFRQHPKDYLEGLECCVKEALRATGYKDAGLHVKALAVDTTGSTCCPVNREGTPLALLPGLEENPNAMFHLWKDHTAVAEAAEINRVLSQGEVDYTKYQGTYSSEWYWAKILHTTRGDRQVREEAYGWTEHSDWIPGLLTGNTKPEAMYRCSCAAGHKALWNSEFSGLPPAERLGAVDPCLVKIAEHYGHHVGTSAARVGTITPEWAECLGISARTVIGGSSFDAHAGAVGAGVGPGTLVKVIGTSTVDMTVVPMDLLRGKDLRQVCGQAEDSIVPGYMGIEAGQAAFGDIYAWFKEILLWSVRMFALDSQGIEEAGDRILPELTRQAKELDWENPLIAMDWLNGRRYPALNEGVRGSISGLTLGTTPPEIFRALALGTVFGSKRIFDAFMDAGISIDQLITVGGISQKSSYIMQMMADVLNRPIMVSREPQTCAKGAAIYGAVAAGYYRDIREAQDTFCEPYRPDYQPDPLMNKRYEALYVKYLKLGNFMEDF